MAESPRILCLFLPDIGPTARLGPVHYFSALAKHMEAHKPDVTIRHQTYVDCLRDTGVVTELGQFKEKRIDCPSCHKEIIRHEEKETDVAVGVRLIELLWSGQCDAAVLVTADSDLAPALRRAKRCFPSKPVYCVLPYARGSFDLRALADRCFKARAKRYLAFQLPDPYVQKDGTKVNKPKAW